MSNSNKDVKLVNLEKASIQEYKNLMVNPDLDAGIFHDVGKYWVTNEGTKTKPNFHVWENGLTHSIVDSAYHDLSLAIARANYLAKYEGVKTIKS